MGGGEKTGLWDWEGDLTSGETLHLQKGALRVIRGHTQTHTHSYPETYIHSV